MANEKAEEKGGEILVLWHSGGDNVLARVCKSSKKVTFLKPQGGGWTVIPDEASAISIGFGHITQIYEHIKG